MIQLYPHLYRTEAYPLFGSYWVSAYFLIRPEGNLLIYSSSQIESHYDFMKENGGLKATMITHSHEASAFCNKVAEHFEVPFYSPLGDAGETSAQCELDQTFEGDFQFDESLEVLSTPGHTPGCSCFLWTAPDGKRILFTGDNIYISSENRWNGLAFRSSDVEPLKNSIRKIAAMNPDVVIPAGSSQNGLHYQEFGGEEWLEICEAAINRL